MFTNAEIKNVANAYNAMKMDLHTYIAKERRSPLDFEGSIDISPEAVTFSYPIREENKSRETYHALMGIGIILEDMLKGDLRIWGKTAGIKCLEVAPDRRCETVVLEIVFQD